MGTATKTSKLVLKREDTAATAIAHVTKVKTARAQVGIFGLGYVGLTTAACLLEKNVRVDGYEISKTKRTLLARGVCPIKERGVKPAVLHGMKSGFFRTAELVTADELPEMIFICVGTPSAEDGSTDLSHVHAVFEQLAKVAADYPGFDAEIILRSTVPPGTLGELQKRHPHLFAKVPIAFYPEFLREGTTMKDFYEPPQSIVGVLPGCPAPEKLLRLLGELELSGEISVVGAVSAETLKFACNAFHALKICFANEVARLVSGVGGDAVEVMDLFCRDTKLNVSRKYLLPGNPYGGSCLPKDTKSMAHLGKKLGIKLDLIRNCEVSNASHYDFIVEKIASHRPRVVTLLGLSFKKNTDDIRNSPSVELLHRLAATGVEQMRIHDFLVHPEEALGLNKQLQGELFSSSKLALHRDVGKALEGAQLVLIMHLDERYAKAVSALTVPVLDVAAWSGFGK